MQQITIRNEVTHGEPRSGENPADRALKLHRGAAYFGAEPRAKGSQALVSNRETHIGHGQTIARQQVFGAVDAHPGQEPMRCLSEGAREESMVMIWREARFTSRVGETYRLIQPGSQIIARAAQSAKELVIHQGTEPVRRRIDEWMRHGCSLSQNPAIRIQGQALAAPNYCTTKRTQEPDRHGEQIAQGDGPEKPQNVAAAHHQPA